MASQYDTVNGAMTDAFERAKLTAQANDETSAVRLKIQAALDAVQTTFETIDLAYQASESLLFKSFKEVTYVEGCIIDLGSGWGALARYFRPGWKGQQAELAGAQAFIKRVIQETDRSVPFFLRVSSPTLIGSSC